ncbi:unnamed protein product [Caenorhabditis brenneri]
MDEKTSAKFIGTNVLVNVVLLIVGIRIAMEYNNISTRVDIIALQIFSALPSAAIFADFARVLLFGVQLINVDGERNEVTKQSVESKKVETKTIPEPEPQSKSVPSKPTCKICSAPRISVTTTPSCNMCSAPYTETGIHIPRIIKECGHSVCEQCVDNLLKLKTENFITCPFCQKVTIVNGSAETLPKNFALLEQIESVQKIPMLININGERKEVTKKSVELKKVKSKSIPKPEPPSKPVAPKPTCNICSAAYTENGVHTPRIIKECGHSVCEKCADKLLNAKCQNILLCPFCQKPTIVNGPAATLPKNFALLEQMTEMQQDPIRMLININGERKEVTKKSVELKKVKSKSTPKPEPPSKPVAPKLTCNICSANYTETGVHTPRILIACGHSVCEQCADKLLKLKTENFLICPFCQKVTIVNGPAAILPKNFALLEHMTEMQQDPIRIV